MCKLIHFLFMWNLRLDYNFFISCRKNYKCHMTVYNKELPFSADPYNILRPWLPRFDVNDFWVFRL